MEGEDVRPLSGNLYAYCEDNPVVAVDPLGTTSYLVSCHTSYVWRFLNSVRYTYATVLSHIIDLGVLNIHGVSAPSAAKLKLVIQRRYKWQLAALIKVQVKVYVNISSRGKISYTRKVVSQEVGRAWKMIAAYQKRLWYVKGYWMLHTYRNWTLYSDSG